MHDRDDIRHIEDIRALQDIDGLPDPHALMLAARRHRADAIAAAMARLWSRITHRDEADARPRPSRNGH